MRARHRLAGGVLGFLALAAPAGGSAAPRQEDEAERRLRAEGEAVIALADGRAGDAEPAGLGLEWHHDLFKARSGTFIPFVVRLTAGGGAVPPTLLYVRAIPRPERTAGEPVVEPRASAYEAIYPVPGGADAIRVSRGCALAPGEYELTVVVRERDRGPGARPRSAVLRRTLSVPDYSGPGLMASTVILAETVSTLEAPVGAGEAETRPYVVGLREIVPALTSRFSRSGELIVTLLIYNPSVTAAGDFDLEVEYHFFRRDRDPDPAAARPGEERTLPAAAPGEIYVNRTAPQRFNALVLGAPFDPAAGQPVLAGQGVPLAGFEPGEYRLLITIGDLVSGQFLRREVLFTVRP